MQRVFIRSQKTTHIVRILLFLLLLAGCQSDGQATKLQKSPSQAVGGSNMPFSLHSPSFANGSAIPKKFACDSDVSPAFEWGDVPANTQSLAFIADDPDAPAGTWVHWVVYDLPSALRQLPENVPKQAAIPGGGTQGTNDFGKTGYGGPCPPPGKPHRYFFKLYALDKKLDLNPGATKQQVERAMKGHILAQAEVMGTYQR